MIQENLLYQQDIQNALVEISGLEKLGSKRVLITGATGMVGSCLTDMLMTYSAKVDSPISVIALARNESKLRERFAPYLCLERFSYVIGDISEAVPVLREGPDIIIHAASNSHPIAYAEDPVGTIKANVFGLDNLLQYAVQNKVERILFLSSVEIYGDNNTAHDKFVEEDCGYINCNTLRAGYPESKRVGEALCQAYKVKYGIDVVIARLSRLYGPTMQMDDSKVISQFIKRAVEKQDIILKSKGKAVYSYTYIVDAVSALLTVLLKGESGEAYNVADSKSEISILNLAELVSQVAGSKIVYELPDTLESTGYSNVMESVMVATKLENLGWKAWTPLSTGVEKTIAILGK
ncbi:MAG: NAD-dependent epimerase/dehydratase family protein [Lachnospiraceae bacterium]|nr:NAD-dependent epimerase/dehydratase family protein [Lachnospiraceae bacterium]